MPSTTTTLSVFISLLLIATVLVQPGRALNFYYFTETERGSHYFMGNTANANVCSPLPFLMLAVSFLFYGRI